MTLDDTRPYPTSTTAQRARIAADLASDARLSDREILRIEISSPALSPTPGRGVMVQLYDLPHRPDLAGIARDYQWPAPEYATVPHGPCVHHTWTMGDVVVQWVDVGAAETDPMPVGLTERIDRALGRTGQHTCPDCGLDVPVGDTVPDPGGSDDEDARVCRTCAGIAYANDAADNPDRG